MEKNKIKLIVCSQNLTILSDEPPSYIYSVAEAVNNRVDEMVSVSRYRPIVSAVVLSAMQYCDECMKLKAENQKLQDEISRLKSEAQLLNERLKDAAAEHQRLVRENKELKNYKLSISNQQSLFDKSAETPQVLPDDNRAKSNTQMNSKQQSANNNQQQSHRFSNTNSVKNQDNSKNTPKK